MADKKALSRGKEIGLNENKAESLNSLKQQILNEDPTTWSAEKLKKCCIELKLSASGTKNELTKRVCQLKKNTSVLDKLVQKHSKTYRFKSSLPKNEIPPAEAPWGTNTNDFPKVTESDVKAYQRMKRQGSQGQYRKAIRMFNSRRVKTVKVLKEGNKLFVKSTIYKSFSNGLTRPAVILFQNGKPNKGFCECAVGVCGLCCHVICVLLFLEHFSSHGEQFLALTCTQKLQRWHKKGSSNSKQTQFFPLSRIRNLRSSRKRLCNSRSKKKTAKNEDSMDMEQSDWMKRDIEGMSTTITSKMKESSINVESHVYLTLKKYGLKSGLFGQLNYNYHYRLKQALEDHDYQSTSAYDENYLKPKCPPTHGDVWHVDDLQDLTNAGDQPVGVTHNVHDKHSADDKVMYLDTEVNSRVQTLHKIIADAKDAQQAKGTKDNKQETLQFKIPNWPALKPFGYNYFAVQQNSQEWLSLRAGKVTCSVIGDLIGLSGEKEQSHLLSCIRERIDPNKVKPKKFKNFFRGHQFEPEARRAFEDMTGVPVSTCGFFKHPSDNMYGGSPDAIGPAYLLEIKTRATGSKEPLSATTASHLLQTNFQMVITGATITFLQSYLPETKRSTIFLIERNHLLTDVVKTAIDCMLSGSDVSVWPHEENNLLKKLGELNLGKVPTFESLKPLRTWVRREASKTPQVFLH